MKSGFFNWLALNKNQISISYIDDSNLVTVDQDGELLDYKNLYGVSSYPGVYYMDVDRFGNLLVVSPVNDTAGNKFSCQFYTKEDVYATNGYITKLNIHDITPDNQGNYYFIENSGGIYRFSISSNITLIAETEAVTGSTRNIALTNSNIFALVNNTIYKFSLTGILEDTYTYPPYPWKYQSYKTLFTHNNQLFVMRRTSTGYPDTYTISKISNDSTLYDDIKINSSSVGVYSFESGLYVRFGTALHKLDYINNTFTIANPSPVSSLFYVDIVGNSYGFASEGAGYLVIIKVDKNGNELWRTSDFNHYRYPSDPKASYW